MKSSVAPIPFLVMAALRRVVRKSQEDAGTLEDASEIETVIGTFGESCSWADKAKAARTHRMIDKRYLFIY